ncbi:MAG: hypothetical protein HEQ13_24835 [Dolichospermum sp. DEX189]|jgi:hypothetical protein|uniref:Transposase n=2 Tax=Aphanizomenonaceae TaxID=1892259 RepID=A0ABY5LUX8_9CYAN|nr:MULTISPECIES: hypothetical protein [Aphanizomenonaceae]MBO1072378.1 hypothetical protein [Dolichospermum sp. DEX189]MDK2409636.1 hypothetical protein [Aphanizomenon sp. 202]MDK2460702.1 hypothetical protein [Aphanizomenon sp. PH219]MBD2279384.1 hypothetical protein [Aphanizomenon flos-aquae FACHB-1040]MBE9257512.1 hypothetical protein [Dolichospermum sp. LEGE 00246]
MLNEIIAIYAITDDLLKAIGHDEDSRRVMNDAEIITTAVCLKVMRKKKSKRLDPPWIQYIKQHTRHYIETVFSSITSDFPKSIHAVTYQGFLLKVQAFIFAFTLDQAFI